MENYFKTITENGQRYVNFDEFVLFIKREHSKNDRMKTVRHSDIARVFSKYRDGITAIRGKNYKSLHSVLRYIFD